MSFKSRTPVYRKKPFVIVGAMAIVIALVGVILFSTQSDPSKVAVKKKSPVTTTTEKKIVLAPLTGLEDPTGDSRERPAVAIKIGNNPEARPQAGITEADIVYEEIVEGGITRYLAIFNSTVPERVGPVRSVRGMDPNIALNWGGIFAYSGGAAKNEAKIKSTKGILALNETAAGSGMKRDSSRGAPNNLYAIPSVLYTKGGTPVPPIAQFVYSPKPSLLADPASSFIVGFKSGFACTWKYDVATSKYLRSYTSNPVVDQKGKQVAAENVVVQFISYPSESEGITTGSGNVWIFRNGKVVKGTWERPTTEAPATFKDAEGNILSLQPGQTWVELASTSTVVTVTP
ncbi:MAG TPA: DUF3048 domain-containing protein [Acidimicrobiia bacterium]|nr:DUF3048 domain-containing protein [Acidimicrobiia bacterium]